MYTNFMVEKTDHIATITLNRPEKRNPINEEMLTGTGKAFCNEPRQYGEVIAVRSTPATLAGLIAVRSTRAQH